MAARPDDPTTDDAPDAAAPDPNADTLADDGWPVSELYDVQPDENGSVQIDSDGPARTGRLFPPPVGRMPVLLVAALLAMLGGAAAAAWWASADDDPVADAAPETRPTTATAPAPPRATSPSTSIRPVPDLVGATYGSARSRLESSGLEPRRRLEHSDRPDGEVLRQSPAAGANAEPGTTVVLTVSSGPDRVSVPDLEGLSARGAARALRATGLQLELRAARSDEPVGTVLAQTPAAGVSVDPGATVTLRVSSGSVVDIPHLEGLTLASARSRLRTLGLRSAVTRVESSQPAGTVVAQSPVSGTELRAGATVRLRVSSGPATVAVPDVTGLDEASARARLRALGFDVETVDEPTSNPGDDGLVVAQDPAAGTDAEKGATVLLTIARFA